ncbi:hypothetical protein VTK73DRAFT_7593 [Phialemonium thermophilum]|uniref:Sphingolipid long chain base-responsive protein LSP1 n=1 Tax=Phialemonium thermophilum TaxID=223376 RepID=A0ABR3WDA6_9PEZI
MCFGPSDADETYYYREEIIPARPRYHHHHSPHRHHHHHHHHHHESPVRISVPRLSRDSLRSSPRTSVTTHGAPVEVVNRALSFRQKGDGAGKSSSGGLGNSRKGFSLSSLRGSVQPELSKRLFRLIKSENNLINAHQQAARERVSIATQLSEWGEQTGDEAVSDISDKVGVVLSEIGEQEDTYAHALDDSRLVLKAIRNIEKSVQPSRDHRAKITDEIARLKTKEPESTKLVTLEQELVRSEAENLVAEAQLSNVTRQKLKEAFNVEFDAIIERAEKQIILARHGKRLLELLDDTPAVPGDARPAYEGGSQARQILNDAEDDLREWRPETGDDGGKSKAAQARGANAGRLHKRETSKDQRRDSGYAPANAGREQSSVDYVDKGSQPQDSSGDRERQQPASYYSVETRIDTVTGQPPEEGSSTQGNTEGQQAPGAPRIESLGLDGRGGVTESRTVTQLPRRLEGLDTPRSMESAGGSDDEAGQRRLRDLGSLSP